MGPNRDAPASTRTRVQRALDVVERIGNALPDPALMFVLLTFTVWIASAILARVELGVIDPRSGRALVIANLLSGPALTGFLANLVKTFVEFHPLGVVLVAMLGIGVADGTGLLGAALRGLLALTARRLLTPLVIAVAVLSHVAVDAGYVLVVPLGGVVFAAAGRHPLAGIAAAFAGVSGGFSATFVPSSLDPLLQGLTQAAAQLVEPGITLNPLNNFFFTTASSLLVIGVGWLVTDRVVEPRLRALAVDGPAAAQAPSFEPLAPGERRALRAAGVALALGLVALAATAAPAASPWRGDDGTLTGGSAPLMKSIVALLFLLFGIPGVVYGAVSGSVVSHRDVVRAMTGAMAGMGGYVVLAFLAAQFIAAFGQSNLGALIAVGGANGLRALGLPVGATLVGVVALTAFVNLFIGSASAKWALLAPILVPMLMQLGLSPDLTQAAYRVGDSSTNIVTPLMPYFPLVVAFCQRWVRSAGIGTLVALMLPYSLSFLVSWTLFFLLWWVLGIPLGLGAR